MPTDKRPNPLKGADGLIDQITGNTDEPIDDLRSGAIPAVLARRRGQGRKNPIRPAERRRRRRQVAVTFSDEEIPERLRALAEEWELSAPDPRKPNISALVEYLLMPQLIAAEAGEIPPPQEAK